MTAKIEATTFGRWHAVELCNERISIVIAPDLGGKITSLRSIPSGRQWLWTNPHLSQRDPTQQTDYVGSFDTGGWDEVFPTVDPCLAIDTPWGDQPLSDHGEIWRRSAAVTSTPSRDGGARSVCLSVSGDPLPFTFERTLTLAANEARLEIEYRLTNHADQPLPYLWAAHPIVRIEPGMRIELPEGTEVRCTGAIGSSTPQLDAPFCWPGAADHRGEPLDLGRVPEPTGVAMKLFTEPLARGFVAVTTADGRESFRIDFDNARPFCLGMWLNYGGWSGSNSTPYFNAGFEPTTSPCDALSDAIARNVAAVVPPNQPHQWTLTTTVIQHQGNET